MKKIGSAVISITINFVTYCLFQIIDTLFQFLLFGSGEGSEEFAKLISLAFVSLQAIIIYALYQREIIFRSRTVLVINILILIFLYIYFSIYLPTILVY